MAQGARGDKLPFLWLLHDVRILHRCCCLQLIFILQLDLCYCCTRVYELYPAYYQVDMADRKPLPDLPNFKIAELSVEARRHRSRLILQALSEAQESGIAGRREEWVEVFEKVLDDFSRELVERDWLHAIKLVEENREQYPQQDTETSKEFTKGDARERSSSNRSLLSSSVLAKAVLPSPTTRPISDEVKQQTLDYLRVLSVEPPTKITSPSGRQLLLCVTPFDTQKSSPYEDGVFAFVPTKVSCAFSSGHYVLPSSESAHPQDTILYGLREWSSKSLCSSLGTY